MRKGSGARGALVALVSAVGIAIAGATCSATARRASPMAAAVRTPNAWVPAPSATPPPMVRLSVRHRSHICDVMALLSPEEAAVVGCERGRAPSGGQPAGIDVACSVTGQVRCS